MEEQEDRISLLPNCVVGTIVSLLPPKAAARTMVLSRRWSSIWSSLPLDLNLDSPNSDVHFLSAGSIISLLSSHRGPIRCFCVNTLAGVGTRAWLKILAQKHIDDTLVLRWASDVEHPTLPRNLLGSAAVYLRHLDLLCCRLGGAKDPCSPVPSLPRLDYLYLSNVLISESALHCMIEVCPVLRELHLLMINGLHRIVFHSRTLQILNVGTPLVPLDEFSNQGMPNLESVNFQYVNLWRIPTFNIDINKRVREVTLKLPTVDSPHLCNVSDKKPLSFVTSLVLGTKFVDGEELMRALHILTLFPCLQRLEIGCYNFGSLNDDGFGFGNSELASGSAICLKKRLTHVVFNGYCGTAGEVEFARYFMANAVSLTAMEINHAADWSLEDVNRQKDSICLSSNVVLRSHISFLKSKESESSRRKVARYLNTVSFN